MEQLTGKEAQGFVKKIEKPFMGLPHLPNGLIEFIVGISPWLAGLGGIFAVLGGINSLFWTGRRGGMWRMAMDLSGVGSWYFQVMAIFSILSGLLLLMAFNGLKAKKLKGWMLLFWVQVLAIIQNLFMIIFGYGGGLVGFVIGILIGLYLLFEIKPKYK